MRRRRVVFGGAAAAAGFAAFGSRTSPAYAGGTMAVSVGKVNLNAAVGMPLAGYGVDSPRVATGVRAPLFARCLVLWDNGTPNVIVSVDVLGLGRAMHQAIRNQITALGVQQADLIVNATHTHNGPVLSQKLDPYIAYAMTPSQVAAAQAYSDGLVARVVTLVRNTMSSPPTPCTLDYRVTSQSFSHNREGLSYVETAVPVLVARGLAGAPLAVVFSYGCHPVSAGQQTQFDPDYPGQAITMIEATTGAFAQFILGPAGDQNPVGTPGWDLSRRLGNALADSVIAAVATPGRLVTGPISTSYREISLPLDVTVTPANLAAVRDAYAQRRANSTLPGYYRRHAEVMIRQIDTNTFATSVPLPLSTWRLAGNPQLRIALTGGEIVSGYGVYFRSRYGGDEQLLFGGYANEVPAYIPSDELLRRPASYAAGKDADYPGIAGGSMTVYGCVGHWRYKTTTGAPDGVEQYLIAALSEMLGAP